MNVCIYIYIHIYVYVYIYLYMFGHMHRREVEGNACLFDSIVPCTIYLNVCKICIYMYKCMCIYIYTYVCMCVYLITCFVWTHTQTRSERQCGPCIASHHILYTFICIYTIYIYMYKCVCVYIYVHIHVCVYVYFHLFRHIRRREVKGNAGLCEGIVRCTLYVYMYIYTIYICMYKCMYIYICTYICVCVYLLVSVWTHTQTKSGRQCVPLR